MAAGFPTKANWVSGDILTAAAQDDLAGTVNLLSNASAASGTVLVSNVAGTSFAYQPLNSAGKNAVINGGMDIWQRGTSFSAGAAYAADRWILGTAGTVTISQDSTTVPTGFRYSMKYLTGAASSYSNFSTCFETANIIPFRGQVCTISWYAIKNATHSGTFGLSNIFYSNTTDAAASQLTAVTITAGANPTPTTSWARYTASFTVPADAMGLSIQFNNGSAQASGAQINFTGVQLELGSVATTFSRAGGTLQGELAACQRYLPVVNIGSRLIGNSQSTTQTFPNVAFPVTARVAPTGTTVGAVGNYSIINGSGTSGTPVAVSFSSASVDGAQLGVTTTLGTPTLTLGQVGTLACTSAGILFTGCEL